jgi:hypothetical protein
LASHHAFAVIPLALHSATSACCSLLFTTNTSIPWFHGDIFSWSEHFGYSPVHVTELAESLIVTYSERRAQKDRADRERLIEKARTLVDSPGKINASFKRGGRKYVRPIFHWTEKRIKGHFVICFLAFLLERKLEQKLKKAGISDASPERIREAINRMEFAEFDLQGKIILPQDKRDGFE